MMPKASGKSDRRKLKKKTPTAVAAPSPTEAAAPKPGLFASETGALLADVRALIESSRRRVASVANSELAMLYWQVGRRIREDVLGQERAAYGEEIVQTLSGQLTLEYGRGFSRTNLFSMIRFAEVFPDEQIVATLSRQLGWSHFVEIIPLNDPLQREFYAEMCRVERWAVRTLRAKIQGMLFERTALSRKPEELARKELDELRESDQMTPDLVFRDPYVLDFLGLSDSYSEKDLEAAILRELERFLLELGTDFTFVARQKRMTVDGQDYYLDLLFFHRRLRRLIALDLKLGRFQAADKGQMQLYVGWLNKYDRQPGEEPPIGLILCAGKSEEHVELLQVEQSGIRVAEYLTEVLPREVLARKLHEAIKAARERLALPETTP
jgi:predicted nuclease of restriction endonuclease-like (RecB) superfamily